MASRRRFRPRTASVEPAGDRGTKQQRLCGWPSNAVGGNAPRAEREGEASADPECCGVDTREKPAAEVGHCPYRKPTQVGEASSLR